ncbi:MAG: 16S rRNA (guanine(966)-N(2))-methyltransferase RsmD [Candidatus Paracaedibacteraceae bacterium]|nr:16S rRNA (guanine(966)-N(2))-methyltransferase RsmD [Candidatus Paracaedibacteraceae bacterium]
MRIIRGELAGKLLIMPKSGLTRPTSDKVRQAVFNILDHHSEMPSLKEAWVLDAFAGTGALGFEALSRGAGKVTFVDIQREMILNLYNLINNWNLKGRTHVLAQDILTLPEAEKAVDYIFCDPPYGKNLINLSIEHLYEQGWIHSDTVIIAEMHKKDVIDLKFSIEILQEKKYGDTKIIFFKLG